MSVALELLPVQHWSETNGKVYGFSHAILPCRRGSDLKDGDVYDDIEQLNPTKLPEDAHMSSYIAEGPDGEHAYGVLKTTPYGKPYTWVSAGDLAPVLRKHHPKEPTTAYVAALSPDTKIILHWH